MAGVRLVYKLYQYYQLSTSFLYAALLARWLILMPLVGSRFLPGGIHEFFIYLMLCSSVVETLWLFKFYGLKNGLLSRTFLKDLNFIYLVRVIHFYDDYEHALILKNASYSSFIICLSLSQAYCHWCKLFKRKGVKERTVIWKINTYITLPILYLSEFALLLLNIQVKNYHSTPTLEIINRAVLLAFFPILLTAYKKLLTK
ncbi:YFR042W [Saccharomyces arboricola H-6]|uniref:YFR042W n=1 Tax=Saccharomyces arboricola (strain H-6 / AS 2.3317 / CBS 10644) TaxID=1160507 RepID=J8Q2I4_SACAR|nr:YFR042W [Saccharomyces arboricola H-6]